MKELMSDVDKVLHALTAIRIGMFTIWFTLALIYMKLLSKKDK